MLFSSVFFCLFLPLKRLALEIVYKTRDISSQISSSLSHLCRSLSENDVIETFLEILTTSRRTATISLIFNILDFSNDENLTMEILLNLDSLAKNKNEEICFSNLSPFCKWIYARLSPEAQTLILTKTEFCLFWEKDCIPSKNWKSLEMILATVNVMLLKKFFATNDY